MGRLRASRRVAHRGEINNRGNASEVLEQDASGAEGDLFLDVAFDVPPRHRFNISAFDEGIVLVAEEILEENLQREGEAVDGAAGDRPERVEAIDGVPRAADTQCGATTEAVRVFHGAWSLVRGKGRRR